MNGYQIVGICFIVAVIAFGLGVYISLNIFIDKLISIAPKFVNITLDKQMVNDALFRYENNIGGMEKCTYISLQKE